MDYLGAEISKKIKSAIRAKLVELGVYVDDELPDYIMVLVANKKTKKQMESDLSLFLSDHTVAFVEWLQQVLDKLQTITLQAKDKGESDEKGSKGSASKEKEKKRKSSEVGSEVAKKGKVDDSKEKERKRPVGESHKSKKEKDRASKRPDSEVPKREEKAKAAPRSGSEAHRSRESSGGAEGRPARRRSPDGRRHPRVSAPAGRRAANAPVPAPPDEDDDQDVLNLSAEEDELVKESTVGAVVSREEAEAEYDPLNPAVGAVASTVRVTERPRRPASQQPRPTLLLKAMRDAQQSTVASVRPFLVRAQNQPTAGKHKRELFTASLPPPRADPCPERAEPKPREAAARARSVEPSSDEEDTVHVTIGEVKARPQRTESVVEPAEYKPTAIPTVDDISAIVHAVADRIKNPPPTVRASSPTFVVTMTGLGASRFARSLSVDEATDGVAQDELVEEEEEEEELEEADLRQQLLEDRARKSAHPVIAPPPEPEPEPEPEPPPAQKPPARCRFWPSCRLGAECLYHHPSVPCKTFPACKFGDTCLYIHPRCKFDGSCWRADCRYSHSGARPSVAPASAIASGVGARPPPHTAAVSMVAECKFFPNCTNPS
ncbi:zinc finger CCCH domain-containing protein 14-like, partial [Pollicipes pollicipes]|uniref:zinc finger CCCH domain-containing protein 14-like n=1 Tax=Pollicipes pollicipes TaxID=41117 RepID=UPI001884C9BE